MVDSNELLSDKVARLKREYDARPFGDVYRSNLPNRNKSWIVKCIHGKKFFKTKKQALRYAEAYLLAVADKIQKVKNADEKEAS